MSALAILIILSSGFIFTSHYPLARLKQIHSTGWALYLHSFIWGLCFSGISLIATELLERKEWLLCLKHFTIFELLGAQGLLVWLF